MRNDLAEKKLTAEEKQLRIEKYLTKAERDFNVAKLYKNRNKYDACIERSYYVVIYSMQAALAVKGIYCRNYDSVIRCFKRTFVDTGIFPKHYISRMTNLREMFAALSANSNKVVWLSDVCKFYNYANEILNAVKGYSRKDRLQTGKK